MPLVTNLLMLLYKNNINPIKLLPIFHRSTFDPNICSVLFPFAFVSSFKSNKHSVNKINTH